MWVHFKIAPSKNAFQNCHHKNMGLNKTIFTDKVITSANVLFAPKSIYKTPSSSNAELSSLLIASCLLIPHKRHLKLTPFTFNIAMFFSS